MWRFGARRGDVKEIDRNAPPRRGVALFVEIFAREWWELFKLNLLMVLFALPVVTIPAMLAATTRITTTMIRDENHYLWRDFWESFRREFWRATLVGWIFGATVALGVAAIVVYARATTEEPLFVLAVVVSLFGTILLLLMATHSFTLMMLTGLPIPRLLGTACLMTMAGFVPGLAALLLCATVWLVHVAAYPVSIFIPATFGFSFCALVMTFQSQRALIRYQSLAHGAAGAGSIV
ncbi:DUF624 domain-containing protein [Pleomorphomonas sp. PLEO]|uniref:DUF624 domain-containing protein n=1 Tax=Pleomorphomonas sp. PLEO TaxID=3239306 RepID=UPI00351E6616